MECVPVLPCADAANFYEPSLRMAAEYYGATQVLAGSDHPYFQEEKLITFAPAH
ncbi:hypothetical protein CDB402_2019 [Corynebacterium diphtheriae INCA 402]|nr:hypothetical protein CDB402_2019 [Corynebacterium diphtheriae INCA 402]